MPVALRGINESECYALVVQGELIFMLAYHFLDTEEVNASLQNCPVSQAQPGLDG
ncbi:hypothetical protein [Escherichia marmotae]|uniref:hypothetical protein n=1 Tax=Escherichia marmotae TaxID=1499973 RepID=UPI00164F7760|nr:hypothetical protein [Escherichia marmotae]